MKKILLLILSLSLITGCGCNKKEENKDNTNKNNQTIVVDTKVNKLDMVDFITLYEEGISEVYYTVENNTEEEISYNYVICEMYDEDNNLIYTLKSELGTLKAGETKDISANITLDLTKVTKTKYSVE